jgi:hypothetical protein
LSITTGSASWARSYRCFHKRLLTTGLLATLLSLYLCSCFGLCTKPLKAFAQATTSWTAKKLEVCHIKRERSHKVFKEQACKGKSSTGWFYGPKLHLVINHLGEIVSFLITAGHTADNNKEVLSYLLKDLQGKCCADKGYLTTLFATFYQSGLQLLVRPKKNMKPLPALPANIRLLKQRAIIESVNDILATVCNVEHSQHRNPLHGLTNILSALVAYQYLEHKLTRPEKSLHLLLIILAEVYKCTNPK